MKINKLSQRLQKDRPMTLERLEGGIELSALIESLRKKGVDEEIITSAVAEVQSAYTAPE